MSEKKTLRVQVIGEPNTGKTTVARIIEGALQKYGFSVSVEDTDPPPGKEVSIDRRAEALKERIHVEVIQTHPKEIEILSKEDRLGS